MAKQIMAIISLSVFALLAGLAVRAWRKRASDQTAEFTAPLEALEFFGEVLAQAKAFYVATTRGSHHLERINAYGLGARGFAQVLVFSEGLLIVRNGERPLAIERAQLTAVEFSQATIDKAVEPDGLLSVSWYQDSVNLATQLRIVEISDRKAISGAVKQIIESNKQREVIK
jgi:hypothetical protein